MVKCFVEAQCLPEGDLCVLHEEEFATIRCLECGYGQYYCHECATLIHRDRKIFHFLEEWKVGISASLRFNGNKYRIIRHLSGKNSGGFAVFNDLRTYHFLV